MAAEWYFRATGGEVGPVSTADLVQGAVEGRIVPDTEVRKGDGPWVPASKVAGLFDRAAQAKASVSNSQTQRSASEGSSVFAPEPKPMYPSPSTGNFEILDMAETDGFKVEILAYPKLGGAKDHQTAANVYFANRAGIRLKQVRFTLRDGEAIAYTRSNWVALTRYLESPYLSIDNNATENAIRPIALGRKDWSHLGSDRGGQTAATLLSPVRSCKLLSNEPFAYLRDVMDRVSTHPASRIEDLLPDRRVWPGPAGGREG
jgi:hypothetical protein